MERHRRTALRIGKVHTSARCTRASSRSDAQPSDMNGRATEALAGAAHQQLEPPAPTIQSCLREANDSWLTPLARYSSIYASTNRSDRLIVTLPNASGRRA